MARKKIPLPKFKSIDEMAHFFDNNSPLNVEGFKEVNIKFARAEDAPKRTSSLKKRYSRRSS